MLEREATIAELNACADALTKRGAGRVALVRGEAGVGKSTLIDEFLMQWRTQVLVMRGWCDPLTSPRPLGPIIDMLDASALKPDARVRAAIETRDGQLIHEALIEVMSAGPQRMWIVEDVHWADGATLDLLRFVMRRIESLPILLVLSYRDDEVGPRHPLSIMLADIAFGPHVCDIEVAPLTVAAVARLARGSEVDPHALMALTGGNPFYVGELLAARARGATADELPRSVSEAVGGRLARLSVVGRETAQAAAVCGPRIDTTLLATVCPLAATGIAECIDAGILTDAGGGLAFRHELGRRATLERLDDHQRRLLHHRVLVALSDGDSAPDALAILSHHAQQAGDPDGVRRYAPAAADRAQALGANQEAAALYALALCHADPASVGVAERARWLTAHAINSYLGGRPDDAITSLTLASDVHRSVNDRLGEGEGLRWLSKTLFALGRLTESIEAAVESVTTLSDVVAGSALAWSLVNVVEVTAMGFDPQCERYANWAIELGTELGDEAVVARARGYAALATVLREDHGWDELEAAWQHALATPGLVAHAGVTGAVLCWTAALHHQLARADGYAAVTWRHCDDHDMPMFHHLVTGSAALVALRRGQWGHAAELAQRVLARTHVTHLHHVLPLTCLALISARRGDRSAMALLDDAMSGAEPSDLFRVGAVWSARAEAAWLRGDDEVGAATARAALELAKASTDPWLVGPLRRWVMLCDGRVHGGCVDDVVTPYRHEVAGDVAAAVAAWTELGCPYDAALARLGGGVCDLEVAVGALYALGAPAAARRAEDRLRRLREARKVGRSRPTTGVESLTRREREVLTLIADGHSDATIAATLYISPKTANRHVGSILRKLNVHNRTQAAIHVHRLLEPAVDRA